MIIDKQSHSHNLIGGNKMKKKNFPAILLIAACIITVSTTQVLAQEQESVLNEINDFSAKLEEKCPDAAAAFADLQNSIINKEGALSIKEKELIALGIAVSLGCEYCVYAHTAFAMQSGATQEEVLEVASVALYMQGGPGLTYIRYVLDALEEIAAMK
jgi:AhpD family alkylhydroperoxidase